MSNIQTFKRYEYKYLLNTSQYHKIKTLLYNHMEEDKHGKVTIQSMYCDTPNYILINRSMEKPMYKEKIRLRSYGICDDNSTVFLELKKKYNSIVYKRRISTTEEKALSYITSDSTWNYLNNYDFTNDKVSQQICKEIDYAKSLYKNLEPKVLLTYNREALYEITNHNLRITFDSNIKYRDYDLNLHSGYHGTPILPRGYILMEIKTSTSIPLWLCDFLSNEKIYRTSFSKYAKAYSEIFTKNAIYTYKNNIQQTKNNHYCINQNKAFNYT